jgi:hypothetical protein
LVGVVNKRKSAEINWGRRRRTELDGRIGEGREMMVRWSRGDGFVGKHGGSGYVSIDGLIMAGGEDRLERE